MAKTYPESCLRASLRSSGESNRLLSAADVAQIPLMSFGPTADSKYRQETAGAATSAVSLRPWRAYGPEGVIGTVLGLLEREIVGHFGTKEDHMTKTTHPAPIHHRQHHQVLVEGFATSEWCAYSASRRRG